MLVQFFSGYLERLQYHLKYILYRAFPDAEPDVDSQHIIRTQRPRYSRGDAVLYAAVDQKFSVDPHGIEYPGPRTACADRLHKIAALMDDLFACFDIRRHDSERDLAIRERFTVNESLYRRLQLLACQ